MFKTVLALNALTVGLFFGAGFVKHRDTRPLFYSITPLVALDPAAHNCMSDLWNPPAGSGAIADTYRARQMQASRCWERV